MNNFLDSPSHYLNRCHVDQAKIGFIIYIYIYVYVYLHKYTFSNFNNVGKSFNELKPEVGVKVKCTKLSKEPSKCFSLVLLVIVKISI